MTKNLTEPVLAAVMPKSVPALRAVWVDHLTSAGARFLINTPARWAAFLAQIAHESNELRRLEENLLYTTAARICAVWPKRFPTEADALPYVRNPEKLANRVYANRLGNGPEDSGDGWQYRGRGLIQLTGRSNYADAIERLALPKGTPATEFAEPKLAALVAAWFWATRGCNALADDESTDDDDADFVTITKRINGGVVGLADRRRYWQAAKQALAA